MYLKKLSFKIKTKGLSSKRFRKAKMRLKSFLKYIFFNMLVLNNLRNYPLPL